MRKLLKRLPKPTLDGLIYQTRWLLYLVNAGLIIAASLYLCSFLWGVWLLLRHAPSYITSTEGNSRDLIIISMVEAASIMVLLIHSIMGTHQIYIRRFKRYKHRPQWLEHADTVSQKIKFGLAFASVSSALLLKDILDPSATTREEWLRHVVTHLVFLVTTVSGAVVWRLLHPHKAKENN